MIYFLLIRTFGHKKVIEMCSRPYRSLEEMNQDLIDRWNGKLHGNDTVYIVGDMFLHCDEPELILRQLRGRKKLIFGNHDGSWIKKVDVSKYFESIDTMLETTDGKRGLTLCHYPLLSWKHARRSFMIHGHIHNDTNADFWPLIKIRDRVLNASVDINNYQPVTFEELVRNNELWKEAARDSEVPLC